MGISVMGVTHWITSISCEGHIYGKNTTNDAAGDDDDHDEGNAVKCVTVLTNYCFSNFI